jgi:hypothetical protein
MVRQVVLEPVEICLHRLHVDRRQRCARAVFLECGVVRLGASMSATVDRRQFDVSHQSQVCLFNNTVDFDPLNQYGVQGRLLFALQNRKTFSHTGGPMERIASGKTVRNSISA